MRNWGGGELGCRRERRRANSELRIKHFELDEAATILP